MTKLMTLDQEAQVARLAAVAREAAPEFGFSQDSAIRLLGYRENAVFGLEDEKQGRSAVFRVHQYAFHTAAEIESELIWMDDLRTAGVHTPAVLASTTGNRVTTIDMPDLEEHRLVSALSWERGAQPGEDEVVERYELVGTLAAQIHNHGLRWRPPASFKRWTIDEETGFGARGNWGDYHKLTTLTPRQRAVCDRAADAVREALHGFGKGSDRYGLIHGDLMTENILIDGEAVHVIDFDDSGHGWHLYDLGTALFMHAGGDLYGPIRDNWLMGYRAARPLPDEHIAMIDTFTMMRALGLLGWQTRFPNHPITLELGAWVIAHTSAFAEYYLSTELPFRRRRRFFGWFSRKAG